MVVVVAVVVHVVAFVMLKGLLTTQSAGALALGNAGGWCASIRKATLGGTPAHTLGGPRHYVP